MGVIRKSKYRVSEGVWVDWEFLSYFLGFVMTDGSLDVRGGLVNRMGWYSSDRAQVDRISDRMGYSHVSYLVSKAGKGEWGNAVFSDVARRFVELFGIEKDKETHSLGRVNFPLLGIPFLRGHLDGDGSIRKLEPKTQPVWYRPTFLARERLAVDIVGLLGQMGFKQVRISPQRGGVKRLFTVTLEKEEANRLSLSLLEGETLKHEGKWEKVV